MLAANYPVIIEGTTSLDPNDAQPNVNDDLWAAHYLLLTGYDDTTQIFIAQDSYHGPDKQIPYSQLEAEWKPFNYIYIVIYFPQDEEEINAILGLDWDPDQNRQNALTLAQNATLADANDKFAWFNLGSNLVYFDRYEEAVQAYDKARTLGLPIRMLRYQFGPYLAYFNTDRFDELLLISEDTLNWAYSSGNYWSEEAWVWKGWALYRKNDTQGALNAWQKALEIHPNFCDAERSINLIQGNDPPAYCVP
jgi:tetratricopeptide (TPR) repeat protein